MKKAISSAYAILVASLLIGCNQRSRTTIPDRGSGTGSTPDSAPSAPLGVVTELEGTYRLKSENMDGDDAPAEWLSRHKAIIFKSDQIIVRLTDGSEHASRFKIDPTKRPAQIDLFPPEEELAKGGKVGHGIYKIVRGELITAFGDEDDRPSNRPTNFEPGKGKIVQVLVKQ